MRSPRSIRKYVYLRFNVIHILKNIALYRNIFQVRPMFVPVCPPNDPHWKLRAYTKWTLQHVFLIALEIRRRNVGTSWRCEYHWQGNQHYGDLSVLCILWLIHICIWIYFLNAIEVAWENYCALGVATNVPKARTEEQSRPVWRKAASSNYTLSCRVTRGQPGIPGRLVALQGRPVLPAGTSALGAIDDKTMHGVVMKLNMDLIFHKFQANKRTPQCVSIRNTVLCTQRYRINMYLLWTNNYFRHYKIL